MKRLIASLVFAVLSVAASGRADDPIVTLPTLHQIREVSLSPSYSCRSREDFAKGYANTALFLTDLGRQRNSPDLLFNGACGSVDYFEAATAGDAMSLVADLGADVRLEELSASRAFNVERVHSFPAYSRFARVVKVEASHTYAVLVNLSDRRGLYVFTVTEYVPNKSVKLRYAVKSYQVMSGAVTSAPGFRWDQLNTEAH